MSPSYISAQLNQKFIAPCNIIGKEFVFLVCVFFFSLSIFSVIFVEMSAKMRSLDREVRGLRMEKEDIERVSVDFICFI